MKSIPYKWLQTLLFKTLKINILHITQIFPKNCYICRSNTSKCLISYHVDWNQKNIFTSLFSIVPFVQRSKWKLKPVDTCVIGSQQQMLLCNASRSWVGATWKEKQLFEGHLLSVRHLLDAFEDRGALLKTEARLSSFPE